VFSVSSMCIGTDSVRLWNLPKIVEMKSPDCGPWSKGVTTSLVRIRCGNNPHEAVFMEHRMGFLSVGSSPHLGLLWVLIEMVYNLAHLHDRFCLRSCIAYNWLILEKFLGSLSMQHQTTLLCAIAIQLYNRQPHEDPHYFLSHYWV
jgi:hypothetical protein